MPAGGDWHERHLWNYRRTDGLRTSSGAWSRPTKPDTVNRLRAAWSAGLGWGMVEYDNRICAQSGPLAAVTVSAALTALGSGRGLPAFCRPSICQNGLTQPSRLGTPITGGNVHPNTRWPCWACSPVALGVTFSSIGAARRTRALHQIAFRCNSGYNGFATALTIFPAMRSASARQHAFWSETDRKVLAAPLTPPVPTRIRACSASPLQHSPHARPFDDRDITAALADALDAADLRPAILF